MEGRDVYTSAHSEKDKVDAAWQSTQEVHADTRAHTSREADDARTDGVSRAHSAWDLGSWQRWSTPESSW